MELKKIINGEIFFSLEISNIFLSTISISSPNMVYLISQKKKKVIKYLMEGYSSKDIADKLDASHRTIEAHRANALNKFNLKNTTELIKKIMEQKIKF